MGVQSEDKTCYNFCMNQKYLVKKVGEYTFKFKMDLNPLTKQYEPHIWHRHLITPDDAIRAFSLFLKKNLMKNTIATKHIQQVMTPHCTI